MYLRIVLLKSSVAPFLLVPFFTFDILGASYFCENVPSDMFW